MSSQNIRGTTALLGLSLLLGSLAWYGCNDGQTSPDPHQDLAGMSLVVDPVVDALSGSDGEVSWEATRRVTRLTEILGLASDPSQQLSVSYDAFRGGLLDLAEQLRAHELGRPEARERADRLRLTFEAELAILLNEAQYDHLQQLRQLHQLQPHAHRDPADRWAEWLRTVQAGPAQIQAVLDALQSMRTEVHGLRHELRDGQLDLVEAFARAQLVRTGFDAALHQFLTPEQYDLLMNLRPDGVDARPQG